MAVNPLYRNEYYFFSGMYDDTLITDFYRKISAETYEKSTHYQHNMLGRKRHRLDNAIFYKSSIGEFKVDDIYNSAVGIPMGSQTLRLDTLIIPVHNKKKFISTYGLNYRKISLVDFYTKSDIFDKTIILQIGKYRIVNAYIIQNPDNTITLAIANSNIEGITTTNFEKIRAEYGNSEPVWIFSDELTQAYFIDTTAATSISSSAMNGYYEVRVPKDKALNRIGTQVNHEHANSWDCLMSFNSNKYGKRVLSSCQCSLKTTSSDNVVFEVNEKFINLIKANSANFNIYFIHRPNRKHLLLYRYNKASSPILNLDYTYNPSGNINIEVYEIDSSTMCKGRKLYDPQFSQVYFPNIFDFSQLNTNNSDLMIEVTEYDPTYTNQVMNNSLTPLIESLTPEFYTEFVVNEYDVSLDGTSVDLKNYHPSHYPVSLVDYLGSEYRGDIRGYMLDKIEKTIESDPYLLASYYKWMSNINQRVTTLSGTPKTFRFGTGKSGEFGGTNPIVMDTSIASATSEDVQYFTEKHSYITYYNSMDKCPSMVYINGQYVRPTCHRFYKGMNYIFFPIKQINDSMAIYANNAELISASPITVDTYPSAHTSIHDVPKDSFTINSESDIIKIFEHIENPMFSLDELVLYDNSTGKYLGYLTDLFNVSLLVSEFRINNPGITDRVLLSRGETIHCLLTILNEIYCTMDAQSIIIGADLVSLSWNDFIDDLISNGTITEDQKTAFMHRKLNFDDIEITPKDSSLIGMTVNVYSRAFKHEYIVDSTSGEYDPGNDISTYTLNAMDLDPNMSDYAVFVDGKLDHFAQLSQTTFTYGGNLILTLTGNRTELAQTITIVHMPVQYRSEYFEILSRVFYMKSADTTKTEISDIWPETEFDGKILQCYDGRIYNNYPIEDDTNMKFTYDGLRLPPSSRSTYRLYAQYYDADRAAAYGLINSDVGFVYTLNNDEPFTKLAMQNPYSDNYDNSIVTNPLDLLTVIP